jgi:hypothetical protein
MAGAKLVTRLKILIRDPVSGTVVVPDLAHLTGGFAKCNGIQGAAAGSVAIGSCDFPLIPPGAQEYAVARRDYDLLTYNQRIEVYEGKVAGDPVWTGVITKLPKDSANFHLGGDDSLANAKKARTGRTEALTLATDKLFRFALRDYSLTAGGDPVGTFTGTLGAYVNGGGWAIAAHPDDASIQTVQNSDNSGGEKNLTSTVLYGNGTYTDCFVEAIFRLTGHTGAGNSSAALVAAWTDANNMVMGRLFVRYVTTPTVRWELDAEIWQKVASVWSLKSRVPIVAAPTVMPFLTQLQLSGKRGTLAGTTFTPDPAGPDYMWRLMMSDFDPGCSWVNVGAGAGTSGSYGLYWLSTGGGAPTVYATQLCFANRINQFTPGAITAGVRSVSQVFSDSTMLDVAVLAAQSEGCRIRKDPKAGLGADLMNFGALGSDLTASVLFQEGVNLDTEASKVVPNAQAPTTDEGVLLSAGQSVAGLHWRNLSPTGIPKYGWITENVQAGGISSFLAAQTLGKLLATMKASPGIAKTLRVYRDASTKGKFREQDTIQVHSVKLGLIRQAVLVLGWTLWDGETFMDIIGDQYPANLPDYQLRQLMQTIDQLAAGIAGISPSSATGGLVFDSRYGSPFAIPFPSGLQPVDSTHPCRIIFFVPTTMFAMQRATVSFSLVAFRSGNQIASGTGSAHNHAQGTAVADGTSPTGNENQTHAHVQGTSGNENQNHGHVNAPTVGAGGAALSINGTALNMAAGPNAGWTSNSQNAAHNHGLGTGNSENATHNHNIGTHTHALGTGGNDTSHTHLLNAPTAVIESGGATGATVILDGVTILAGPYNTDQTELDITQYLTSSGKHELQITTSALGGIFGQVTVFGLAKA